MTELSPSVLEMWKQLIVDKPSRGKIITLLGVCFMCSGKGKVDVVDEKTKEVTGEKTCSRCAGAGSKNMTFYELSKALKTTKISATLQELQKYELIKVTHEEAFTRIPGMVKREYGLTELGQQALKAVPTTG